MYVGPVKIIGFGDNSIRFLFSFRATKYSLGTFLRLKAFVIIFLRKPCQIASSFRSSLAVSFQDCAPYSNRLRTQASSSFMRVRHINIPVSQNVLKFVPFLES